MIHFQNQHDAFLYALKHDLPTFIYEFLKLGLEPANIFFPDDGEQRYQRFFKELYNGGDEYKVRVLSAALKSEKTDFWRLFRI